jgi:hypothetical protein
MSHRRELLPGTWVLGATISADELNALDLANSIRHTLCFRATGSRDINRAFAPLLNACERARQAIDRQPPDVCHHCGAPSPGDVCRYCNTVYRRTTT